MATSQKMTDQFLTCTVCMEIFTDPCTLTCQHTFCRKCVTNFTKTQTGAIRAKSFCCPCCRSLMKVPDPERPVEEWAWQVKPSFLIQGLLDSFGPGSNDTTHCSYCKEEGETTLATVWCSVCDDALCDQCLRVHKRSPYLRHHVVDQLTEEVKVRRKRKAFCKEHVTETVEFLCKDCKKTACQKCCILYHRKCESVVTLESELPSMKTVLTKHREAFQKKHDYSRIEADKQKNNFSEFTKMYSETEKEIRSEGERVKNLIDEKVKKLLTELKDKTDEQLTQLNADIKTEEMASQMYQQQYELIDQAVKSESEMDIYDMYQSCESWTTDTIVGTERDGKDTATIAKIIFRTDHNKLSKSLEEMQLGEINILYEGQFNVTTLPVFKDIINITVTGDKMQSCVSDVTVLDVDGIDTVVVTDWNNRRVKSFYTWNNQPRHARLCTDSSPHSLTQVKNKQVAITVPSTSKIITVKVNPDLKYISAIKTEKPYWGITSLSQSHLAVSTIYPFGSVDILDMTGAVIRSISKPLLQSPRFLCRTKKGNILVSDEGTKAVLCPTQQGDVLFKYRDIKTLETPQGIISTDTGDILVTDFNQHRVLHLTESGQFVRYMMTSDDRLQNPKGVYIDTCSRLYVCMHFQVCVKVYQ